MKKYDPITAKAYREKNKEKAAEYMKEYNKTYREKNKQKAAEYQKEYREKNKEKATEYHKDYRTENKAKLKAYEKDYREKNKDKKKEYKWRLKGIDPTFTLEDYNELLEKQNFCCAICGQHQSELTKALAVDHDHETGKVRGLLCFNCNSGLGALGDNVEGLLKALDYIGGEE